MVAIKSSSSRSILLSLGLALGLGGCAGRAGTLSSPDVACEQRAAWQVSPALADAAHESAACDAALAAADIAAVEPLWVPNPTVKSPAYTLGGVLLELRGDRGLTPEQAQRFLGCRNACSGAAAKLLAVSGVQGSVTVDAGHLTMILRTADPHAAHELLRRAEALHPAR